MGNFECILYLIVLIMKQSIDSKDLILNVDKMAEIRAFKVNSASCSRCLG